MSDDDGGADVYYRYASELFEDRIAREYGEQYTQVKIDEDIETLEARLANDRVASFDQAASTLGSGRYVSFNAADPERNRYPSIIVGGNTTLGRGEFYRSLNQSKADAFRNAAISATVFFNLNSETQLQVLSSRLAPPSARPPLPPQSQGFFQPLYRSATAQVPRIGAVRSEVERKLTPLLASLGATAETDIERPGNITINLSGLISSDTTFQTADQEELRILSLANTNFVWYTYLWYTQQLRPESEQIPYDEIATRCSLQAIAELFVRVRVRKYILEAMKSVALEQGIDENRLEGIDVPYLDTLRGNEAQRIHDALEATRAQRESELRGAIRNQPGSDPEPDQPEQARLRRFAEQCFLLDYLRDYALINQARNPTYVHEQTGDPDFHMLHGRTETIINKLVYNAQLEAFNQIRPSEFSGLVPQIRLYKVFSEVNADGSRGTTYEQEIPFSGAISPGEVASMINSNFDRGQGVGLKSFDWRLEGTNPFTARRDIYGELKIFFQSLDELVKERRAPAVFAEGSDTRSKPFRYIDLVNIGLTPQASDSQLGFVWNPDYYQIKVDVGWASPDDAANVFQTPQMAQAIEQSRMTLFLSAVDHEIDINDQGNVSLSIDYIAYQEASYQDSESDILSDRTTRERRLRNLKTIQEARASGCSADQLATLRQEYTEDVRTENFRNYNRIIKSLFDKERIFYTNVRTDILDSYINDGRTQFSQPLIDTIFGSGDEDFAVRANTSVDEPVGSDRAPDTIGGNEAPENEDQLKARLQNLTYDVNSDIHALQFFYFGDLLQIVLEEINNSTSATEDQLSSESKVQKDLQILLGPINYLETVGRGDNARSILLYDINLADIPISVNYYIDWFLGAVIAQERTIYPLLNFIRDIANNLLSNMMRTQCHGLNNVERENLQLRTNFFNAAGNDPLGQAKNAFPEGDPYNLVNVTVNGMTTDALIQAPLDGSETRIDVDELFGDPNSPLPLAPSAPGRRATKYMLLYAMAPGTTENLTGDPENDRLRGIYHLGIGKDRGILNSIKFNKTDIGGLREARFENSFINQLTGLAILSNVYDVEIKCAGNTMFYPGMKIYVDPRGLSPEMGNPARDGSISNILGIGGYHTIHKVRSYVESGKFETTVNAVFESAARSLFPGVPATSRDEEEAQSACDESIGESVREG